MVAAGKPVALAVKGIPSVGVVLPTRTRLLDVVGLAEVPQTIP